MWHPHHKFSWRDTCTRTYTYMNGNAFTREMSSAEGYYTDIGESGVGISEDTVKVIALILLNIVGGWDIKGHCQGYCTNIGEYCLELGYSTGSATLLRVAISSVETRKSRDFLWWKLRGISEDVTRV